MPRQYCNLSRKPFSSNEMYLQYWPQEGRAATSSEYKKLASGSAGKGSGKS